MSVIRATAASEEPDDEPTIHSVISAACDRYESLESFKVAHQVLAESRLRFTNPQERFVLPLVIDAIETVRRGRVRSVEREAFPRSTTHQRQDRRPVVLTGGHYQPDVVALRQLLDQTFRVERGGDVVTWGAATADQHRQRAAALRKQEHGLAQTAARHESAATMIDKSGMSCLAAALEASP